MKRVRVCSVVGCPEIVTADRPCPTHARPANASWSPQRDRKTHWKLRNYVIATRGAACERCGQQALDGRGKGLHLHHHGPRDLPTDVTLLCHTCHRAVDTNAR